MKNGVATMEKIEVDEFLHERYKNLVMIEELMEEDDYDESKSYEFGDQICKSIYNKDDIKVLLKCEDDKALRFLKVLFQMKYSIKIGKEYYVKKEDFDDFFTHHLGQSIAI